MLSVLCSGILARDPQKRVGSQSGRAFTTALMRVPCEGGEAMLVSLIAFNTTAAEALLLLGHGDSLAVAGRAKASSWTGKEGDTMHGLSVVVDQVLTLYALDKRRKRVASAATEDEAPT